MCVKPSSKKKKKKLNSLANSNLKEKVRKGESEALSLQCVNCSVMSNSLQPFGLWLSGLFCPWNSPGNNPGEDPGDLPDPRIKPGSPALQADFLLSEPPEKPTERRIFTKKVIGMRLLGLFPDQFGKSSAIPPLTVMDNAQQSAPLWTDGSSYHSHLPKGRNLPKERDLKNSLVQSFILSDQSLDKWCDLPKKWLTASLLENVGLVPIFPSTVDDK